MAVATRFLSSVYCLISSTFAKMESGFVFLVLCVAFASGQTLCKYTCTEFIIVSIYVGTDSWVIFSSFVWLMQIELGT